ncbi:hypothetical protein O5D80_002479 [Batrachochytrium dendrobatidis]|nr:hypothetical protein O5D80_002479 [Batrachochytrium dendrobatidis]
MDELDLSILDKDQKRPMDESSSGTFNQVSGSTNEPIPQIPEDDWQEIMDIIHSKNPNQDQQQQNQQDPIDLVDPSTSKRGQKRPMDESSSGTFNQVSGSTNEPIPQIPEDDWQEIMDIIHSKNPNQDQQQPIDELSLGISSQVSGSTNEPIPQIPDEDWQEIMDIINSSTSNQDQQQPMNEADSASTSSSRMIILNEKYQITFDRLRKRLASSKEIRNKKRQEYHKFMTFGYRKWSALAMGKEIHGSKYNPEDEKKAKKEYVAARNRVASVRKELKKFTERHGLEFQEPNSDPD